MVNKKKQLPGKCASDELYCYDNAVAIEGMEVSDSKTSDFLSSTSSEKSSSVYVKMKTESEKSGQRAPPVSFITLFRHSDLADKFLIFLGIVGAIIHGVSSPFMVIIFGELADSFVRYSSCVGFSASGKPLHHNFSNINCSRYYGRVENETDGSEDLTEQMAFFAIYYLICSAVVLVVGFLQVFTLSTSAARQSRKIRCLLFRSIAHQEREWIDNHEAHEINSKLDQDVSKISEVIGDKTGCFVQSASASLFGIAIGFYHEWRLTLVILSAAPVLAGATVLMGKFHGIWCEKEAKAYVKAGSIVESVLKNIRTVVAYGAEEQEVNRYDEKLTEAKSIGIKKGVMRGAFQGVIWCALILTFALAFWYGSSLVLNQPDDLTVGKLLTVFLSIMYAVSSLGHAASIADSIFAAESAARGIFGIIDKDSKIDASSEVGQIFTHVKGEISFDNVSFCYPVREKYAVLNGYCAHFEPGKIYAITGPSGSGKSTVLKLIQRLYDPKRGKILLDNNDISTMKVRWLRSLIGVVRQEPTLFATTILENIKLGCDAATIDDVVEAAKAANAYDFIMNLPEKFDTLVGMQGCHLSGGQKQRIAIARALVRKPKILLLDQPCSALDTQSEAIVLDALQKSRLARTTIVVTHRPSTIRIADHVMEIKQDGCLGKSLRERKKSFRNSRIVKSVDACRMIEFMTKYNETTNESVFDSETTLDEASWMSACESEIGDGDDESDDVNGENGTSRVSTNRIISLNRSEWPHFVIGSLAALVNGAVQPVFAMILSAVIGVHVLPDDKDKGGLINYYCSLMVGLGGFTFFAYLIQNSVFAFSGEILTRRLRRMTFAAILRQEMAFFDDHTKKSCSLPYLLAYHVTQVQGLSGVLIGIIVGTATTVVLTLVITLYSGWQLALLQFACFPIIIASHAIDSKMHGNTVRDQKHVEEGGQIVLETLNAHETVVHLGKEQHFVTRFENVLSSIARNKQKRSILQGISYGIAHAVNYLTYAATFRLGAYLIETGEITFENLFRVYFVIVFAAISIGRNIKHMPDFAKARKSAAKIFRLLDRKSAIDAESTTGIHPISEFNGELELKSCSFAYSTRPDCLVLNNLDVSVEKGQTLALVGRSGCGKSTVVQMIERFYDPTHGSVCINGRDAKVYNVKYLRSKIGAAFQDPVLFEGTVFDNIAYGLINGQVTKDDVISAAQTANIHDSILRLDKGYETMLGPGGRGLSRGEKQRVAIARALIRNPAILLLDEATSCLDEANEEAVQKALKKAREGRTTVIVAHKLETIQDADIIAVISGGNVVEAGTHKDLMEIQGSYYNMIQTGATLA